MRLWKLVAVAALLLALAATVKPALAASSDGRLVVLDSAWGSLNNPIKVRAGTSDVTLVFRVLNNSTDTVGNLVLCANLTFPFTNSTGGSLVCDAVGGTYGSRSTFTASFRLSVDPNAKPGLYHIPITVHYNISRSGRRIVEHLVVPAEISSPIRLIVLDVGWGSPDNQELAWPGDTAAQLYVRVMNPTDEAVRGLRAYVENRELFSVEPPRIYSSDSVATLQGGGSATLTVTVGINPEARPGIYPINLTLVFIDENGARMEQKEVVRVVVTGKERLTADYRPALCVQGSSCLLPITVSNEGTGPALDVEVSIGGASVAAQQQVTGLQGLLGGSAQQAQVSTSSLVVLGVPKVYLGRIDPGSSRTVEFRIYAGSSAAVGAYTLTLTVSYARYDGTSNTLTYSVPVKVAPWISPLNVSLGRFVVSRGRLQSVELLIHNSGGEIRDLVVSALPVRSQGFGAQQSQAALKESSQIFRLGALPPNATKTLLLDVAALSDSDTAVTLQLKLTYIDSGGNYRQESRQVDILAASRPLLTVEDLTLTPSQPYNGSTVILQGRLVNTGVGDALNTKIKLEAGGYVELTQDSKRFIGSVSTDSPTRFSLKFRVPATAPPSRLNLTVVVEYQDSLGNTYVTARSIVSSIIPKYPGSEAPAPSGLLGRLRSLMNEIAENHMLQAIWGVVLALTVLAIIVVVKTRRKRGEEILEGLEAV